MSKGDMGPAEVFLIMFVIGVLYVCMGGMYNTGAFYPIAPAEYRAGYEMGSNAYPNDTEYNYVCSHSPTGKTGDDIVERWNGYIDGYKKKQSDNHVITDKMLFGALYKNTSPGGK